MRKRRKKRSARSGPQAACQPEQVGDLSESLEDYLETIYLLENEKGTIRVRDIAERRGVRMPSVVEALRRLRQRQLVDYEARGEVRLTQAGRDLARLVLERHEFLKGFLVNILGVDPGTAERDACAMEHQISSKTLARLASFYHFLRSCPKLTPDIAEEWRRCSQGLFGEGEAPPTEIVPHRWGLAGRDAQPRERVVRLSELRPGQRGIVVGIRGRPAIRLRLVEMGVLPDVPVEVEGVAPLGDPIRVRLRGYQLSLRRSEAETVLVAVEE